MLSKNYYRIAAVLPIPHIQSELRPMCLQALSDPIYEQPYENVDGNVFPDRNKKPNVVYRTQNIYASSYYTNFSKCRILLVPSRGDESKADSLLELIVIVEDPSFNEGINAFGIPTKNLDAITYIIAAKRYWKSGKHHGASTILNENGRCTLATRLGVQQKEKLPQRQHLFDYPSLCTNLWSPAEDSHIGDQKYRRVIDLSNKLVGKDLKESVLSEAYNHIMREYQTTIDLGLDTGVGVMPFNRLVEYLTHEPITGIVNINAYKQYITPTFHTMETFQNITVDQEILDVVRSAMNLDADVLFNVKDSTYKHDDVQMYNSRFFGHQQIDTFLNSRESDKKASILKNACEFGSYLDDSDDTLKDNDVYITIRECLYRLIRRDWDMYLSSSFTSQSILTDINFYASEDFNYGFQLRYFPINSFMGEMKSYYKEFVVDGVLLSLAM